MIDGEMCVQDANGITDFGAFKQAIASAPERLVLFAFDLLMLDGRDLRGDPLIDRRKRLQDLIGRACAAASTSPSTMSATGRRCSGPPNSMGLRGSCRSGPIAAISPAGPRPG